MNIILNILKITQAAHFVPTYLCAMEKKNGMLTKIQTTRDHKDHFWTA